MRKSLVLSAALVVAAILSISACGGSASPTVTVTKEVAPAPAPTPAPAPQSDYPDMTFDPSDYLAYLRSQDSSFNLIDDGTAVETGTSVCLALAGGTSVETIVVAAIDAGLTSNQAAAIIVGSVRYLCPEYADDVQRQVNSY